jgi:hypothetical protein
MDLRSALERVVSGVDYPAAIVYHGDARKATLALYGKA